MNGTEVFGLMVDAHATPDKPNQWLDKVIWPVYFTDSESAYGFANEAKDSGLSISVEEYETPMQKNFITSILYCVNIRI